MDFNVPNTSFQSILQLSIALNIGFVALISVFGNRVDKELRRFKRLMKRANYHERNAKNLSCSNKDKFAEIRHDIAIEIGNAEKAIENIEDLAYQKFRIPAMFSAVISATLLIIISIFNSDTTPVWVWLLALVSLVPFIIFVFIVLWKSQLQSKLFENKRQTIDNKLAKLIDDTY